MGNAGAGPAGLRLAVHDGGVHLVGTGIRVDAALAGVEEGAVLEEDEDRLHNVHGGLACSEQVTAAAKDLLEGLEALGDRVDVLDVARAAVDADRPVLGLVLLAC